MVNLKPSPSGFSAEVIIIANIIIYFYLPWQGFKKIGTFEFCAYFYWPECLFSLLFLTLSRYDDTGITDFKE